VTRLVLSICFLFFLWQQLDCPQPVYAMDNQNIPRCIIGDITGQIQKEYLDSDKKDLFVPSTSGLYQIRDDKIIKRFFPGREIVVFAVIPDQDSDNSRDLVIALKDNALAGILCVSSKTEEILWQFSPQEKIQNRSRLTEIEPTVTGLISSGEKGYLYLSGGCSVYKISTDRGYIIWKNTDRGNIFSLSLIPDLDGDKLKDLSYINNYGEIVNISSRGGEFLTKKKANENNPVNTLANDDNLINLSSIPRFFDDGFIKDEEGKGYLLLFSVSRQAEKEHKIGYIRKTTADGLVVWEYLLDDLYLKHYSGMGNVSFCSDLNGDGVNDISASFSPEDLKSDIPARIMTLDGKDGKVLWQANLVQNDRILSVLSMEDINKDGFSEFIANTSSQFYIINGSDGKILRSWAHFIGNGKTYFEPTKGLKTEVRLLSAGDINRDGVSDLFLVSNTDIRLALTNRVGGIDFYYKDFYKISDGKIDIGSARVIRDLNRDGIAELYIKRLEGKETIHTLLSGKGRMIIEEYGERLVFYEAEADFNKNNTDDLILYKDDGDKGRELQVLDGSDGSRIWRYAGLSGEQTVKRSVEDVPACMVKDLNNDTVPELAVLKDAASDTGIKIEIFDITGRWEQPYRVLDIQKVPVGELNQHWGAGYSMRSVILDNRDYLVFAGGYAGKEGEGMLIIYDQDAQRTVTFLPDSHYRQLDVNEVNSVVVADSRGKVNFYKFLNENPSVRIINGEENASAVSSPVKIQWKNLEPFAITRIFVDNVFMAETSTESIEIHIGQGNHIIGVAHYLPDGRNYLNLLPVRAVDNNWETIISVTLSLIIIGLIFMVPFLIQRYLRAGVRDV